jgi:uncharacterized protein
MRYLYLHGFASGPTSRKARFLRDAMARSGFELEIPALDQGDFEHLTITGQLSLIESLLNDEEARIAGSSMGGYLAALYALIHKDVSRIVLLAPALGFAPIFEETTPPERLAAWRESRWMDVFHHSTGDMRRIHYGLMEDARRYPSAPDFTQRALVFHGLADDVVPISLSRTFARAHPNVELIEMQSGHELVDVLDTIAARAIPFLTGA